VRTRLSTLLIDLNSQRDFLHPNGALPVVNYQDASERIHRLMVWAMQKGLRVVSSLDAHRPEEGFHDSPRHCVDGEIGQRKLPFTLMPSRILVEADNSFALPYGILQRYQQVIFRKRTLDLFGNPKADRLLTETDADQFWVFGIATNRSVKSLVLGLLARHKTVGVITDACGHWDVQAADMALRQMAAKSAELLTVEEFIARYQVASKPHVRVRRRRHIA
jgi:nicotinamidase-related amidase